MRRYHGEAPGEAKGEDARQRRRSAANAADRRERIRHRHATARSTSPPAWPSSATSPGSAATTTRSPAQRAAPHRSTPRSARPGRGGTAWASWPRCSCSRTSSTPRASAGSGSGRWASIRSWLDFHVFVGFMSPLVIAFHAAFQSNNLLASSTAASLAIVVGTGIVGRFIYGAVPSDGGKAMELADLSATFERLRDDQADSLALGGAAARALMDRATSPVRAGSMALLFVLMPLEALVLRLRLVCGASALPHPGGVPRVPAGDRRLGAHPLADSVLRFAEAAAARLASLPRLAGRVPGAGHRRAHRGLPLPRATGSLRWKSTTHRHLVSLAVAARRRPGGAAGRRRPTSSPPASSAKAHQALEGARVLHQVPRGRPAARAGALPGVPRRAPKARVDEKARLPRAAAGDGARVPDLPPRAPGTQRGPGRLGPGGQKGFDHTRTGFELKGKHRTLDCARCHDPRRITDPVVLATLQKQPDRKTFLGQPKTCEACHFDEHRGQLGVDCQRCHTEDTWKPARGFDHARTAYPLTGRHVRVDCAKCHLPQEQAAEGVPSTVTPPVNPARYLKFKGVAFQQCTDCHKDPHQDRFGPECSKCHTTDDWKRVSGQMGQRAFHEQDPLPAEGRARGGVLRRLPRPVPRAAGEVPGPGIRPLHRLPRRRAPGPDGGAGPRRWGRWPHL